MPSSLSDKFKYKSTFFSKASVVSLKGSNLSKASLKNLKDTLEISQGDIENNPDLLFLSADLYVSDSANKNGDLVDKEGAFELAKQVPNKYLNIEHEQELIVGSLISPFYREYSEEREMIEESRLKDYEGPVVVGGTGYIWKSVNPELAEFLIEASEEDSENYGMASMSWEVYFNDFEILKGSKYVAEGKIISEKQEIEKMKPFLRCYGGNGDYNGSPIYRLIKGEKLFLGAGIVKNPAADVKGIVTSESEIIKNKNKKNSQVVKINVKPNKAMKISNITDYKNALASLTNGEEVNVTTLASLEANFDSVVEKAQASAIADEIRMKSEEFAASISEKDEAIAKAEEARAALEKKVQELEEAKAAQATELSEIKERLEAEEKQRVFDERMTALSSEFNIEGELAKIVAEEIKYVDEEAYSAWLNKFKILAGSHSKAKASAEETEEGSEANETDESETEELVEEEVEAAVAEASEKAIEEVTNSQYEYKSLKDEFENFEFELAGK